MPVSTVLGRKTVSNILEYLKKMFKGGGARGLYTIF